MKCRTSFVSNSSSSSFIITDKNNFDKVKEILKDICGDYYEYNNTLYTSNISDCYDMYYEISKLSSESFDYNEYNYSEIEGERGVDTVLVPPEVIKTNININKVYNIVKDFLDSNDALSIACSVGSHELYEFFNKIYKIIYNTNEDIGD